MKSIHFIYPDLRLSFLLLALVVSIAAKSQSQDTESTIRMLMNEQQESWNRGDIESFMVHYWNSDSLLFIGSRGPTYGWDKTLNNYQVSYPNREAMGELTFRLIKVKPLDDKSAYVVGSWYLSREEQDAGGYFSLLWKKIDGEWKIVSDHSSAANEVENVMAD